MYIKNNIVIHLNEKNNYIEKRHFKLFKAALNSRNIKVFGINAAIAALITVAVISVNKNVADNDVAYASEITTISNNDLEPTILVNNSVNSDTDIMQLSTSKKTEDIHSEKFRIKLGKELLATTSKYPHYYHAHLETYLDYKIEHMNLSFDDVITRVNIGLYLPFYSFYTEEGYLTDNFACLNKYTRISEFAYDHLYSKASFDEINKTGFKLRKDVSKECENMMKAAKKAGVTLKVTSAFLSYDDQKKAYDAKVEKVGQEAADLVIERPGYSYAQLGTKVVFSVKTGSKTEKWLKDNAYKYGFVFLFPKGKQDITGYSYNPGAFHYVGKEYALKIKKSGKTFEELLYRDLDPGKINYSTDSEFTDEISSNSGISRTYTRA